MIRVLVGGLVSLWACLLLVAFTMNGLLYGWDGREALSGLLGAVLLLGGLGHLRHRAWARRILLAALFSGAAILGILRLGPGFAQYDAMWPTAWLEPILLLIMGVSLLHPSVARRPAPSSRGAQA